jgi:hypothetical protein
VGKENQTVAKSIVMVRRQFFDHGIPKGPAEEEDEIIEVHKFVVEPARVGVGLGVTINMGNYESARIDVNVQVPCYVEEADAAYQWARNWAAKRVESESADVKASKGNEGVF